MKNFPFKEIAKRALNFTYAHKWLMPLGLFILGQGSADAWAIIFDQSSMVSFMPAVPENPAMVADFIALHGEKIAGLLLLGIAGAIFYLIVGAISESAVLDTVVKDGVDKKLNLRKSIRSAEHYAMRVFGLRLANAALIVLALALLATPIFILFSKGYEQKALVLSVIGLLIFIPFSFFVSFVFHYAVNFVVQGRMRLKPAIAAGTDLAAKYWLLSLAQTLWSILLYTLASIAFALAVSVAGLFLKGLVFLADKIFTVSLGILSDVVGLVLLAIVGLAFAAVVSVWESTFWAYTWQELVRRGKSEQKTAEEIEAVPEVSK